MASRRRRGASPTSADAAGLAAALDHALQCFDAECEKCLDYEDLLDSDGPHGLAQALRTVDLATEGAMLALLCVELLQAVKRVREKSAVSNARAQVNISLGLIAKHLGFPLPVPSHSSLQPVPAKRRRKEKARLVLVETPSKSDS